MHFWCSAQNALFQTNSFITRRLTTLHPGGLFRHVWNVQYVTMFNMVWGLVETGNWRFQKLWNSSLSFKFESHLRTEKKVAHRSPPQINTTHSRRYDRQSSLNTYLMTHNPSSYSHTTWKKGGWYWNQNWSHIRHIFRRIRNYIISVKIEQDYMHLKKSKSAILKEAIVSFSPSLSISTKPWDTPQKKVS